MKSETVNSFKCLINNFYYKVSHCHSQMAQKNSLLQALLCQNQQIPIIKIHRVKKSINSRMATQESIEENEYLSNCSVISQMSTKMFQDIPSINYAFQLKDGAGIDCSSYNFSQIITTRTRQLFTDPSIYKVIIYALFVNYSNIKDGENQENQIGYGNTLSQCSQIIKIVKKNMVSAAHNLKSSCTKKYYAKIRYLFDELIKCMQNGEKRKEEFIKIIMEEFELSYIEEIFRQMEKGIGSIKSQCSKRTNLQHSFITLNNILVSLNIKLTLMSQTQIINLGKEEYKINLIVSKEQNGLFILHQIITLINNRECSRQKQ